MKLYKWVEAQKKLNSKQITYLWFGTNWCGDCHMMEPIIMNVEKHYKNDNNIQFIKVDAEEANLFRKESKYKVIKIPTHVLIKNGNIVNIFYEYIDEINLINEIEKIKND